jgi:hypothetical protein
MTWGPDSRQNRLIHINVRDGNRPDIMAMDFHMSALCDDDAVLAFPLVLAAWSGADLPAWRAFVQSFQATARNRNAGLLAIRDRAETICGVLAYRVGRDWRAERTFNAELFIAADIVNSERPVRALLDAAEAMATELDCGMIQIRLNGSQKVLASRLRNLGLTLGRDTVWTKRVDPATRN